MKATNRTARHTPPSTQAKREHPGWRVGTLVIAILGAMTGIAGLVLGLARQAEERAISLSGHATVTTQDSSHGLHVIRLSLANAGVRGIVIQDASLWVGRTRLSTAIGYFLNLNRFSRPTLPVNSRYGVARSRSRSPSVRQRSSGWSWSQNPT